MYSESTNCVQAAPTYSFGPQTSRAECTAQMLGDKELCSQANRAGFADQTTMLAAKQQHGVAHQLLEALQGVC
jgi:hypothetical protein